MLDTQAAIKAKSVLGGIILWKVLLGGKTKSCRSFEVGSLLVNVFREA